MMGYRYPNWPVIPNHLKQVGQCDLLYSPKSGNGRRWRILLKLQLCGQLGATAALHVEGVCDLLLRVHGSRMNGIPEVTRERHSTRRRLSVRDCRAIRCRYFDMEQVVKQT